VKSLVIGSGGREHALVSALLRDGEVGCVGGNPGIAAECEVLPGNLSAFDSILSACRSFAPDLVVVGPEDPLVLGLADFLRAEGFQVFGPGMEGAKLEASKDFSKQVMAKAGVPTAAFQSFTEVEPAKDYARSRFDTGFNVVVKASGNALGKGVVVCASLEEADDALESMLVERIFGDAGSTVVVEDRLIGEEISLLTVVGDHDFWTFPLCRDHKRALDRDRGPNTGGMGTVSPLGGIHEERVQEYEEAIVRPLLNELKARHIDYRGMLFSGLMMHENAPYCLEYNVRFGDPETQSLVMRTGSGMGACLLSAALGEPISPPTVLDNAACTVVLASGGYPGTYEKGKPITIGKTNENVKIFHAGTQTVGGELVTSGGRVLGVSASAPTLSGARASAYEAVKSISFDGMMYRTDIGESLL